MAGEKIRMTVNGIVATKEDAEAFCSSCVSLRALWKHYRTLFEGSDLKCELLQTTAPVFFGDLNAIFIEQLAQRVCRLTDNAQTMGRKNLTIKFLVDHTDFSAAPATLDKLRPLSDAIHRFRDRIVEARNRYISHLDLEAVRLDKPLGAASDTEWLQFWLDLQDFLDLLLQQHGMKHFYLNAMGNMSDADSLLQFATDQAGHWRGRWWRSAEGLRLGEGLASVSASPAFGGFGRLLREGTHRAHHSVLLV
jgi:hypothetical protein